MPDSDSDTDSELRVPLAALLDTSAGPPALLPREAAVLGPLPPSAPLNVAAWVVSVGSLPAFHTTSPRAATPRRALIVTGPRAAFHAALEDEDEPHLRTARLERVDMRYCPSPGHVRLLLSLLTSSAPTPTPTPTTTSASATTAVYTLPSPSLIVLYDILALFDARDENHPNDPFAETPAAAYLSLIAAARAAASHLGAALLILEPSAPAALPILPTTAVPDSARSRRVPLADGLQWLLGCVGVVTEIEEEEDSEERRFTLAMGDTTAHIVRRRAERAEFAAPLAPEEGAWAWSWRE